MAVARKRFRPPLWGTLGLIFMGAICISAGLWQMGRADQKREMLTSFETAESKVALRHLVSNDVADDFRYQRFEVVGQYDGAHQVLLDNMIHEGRIGYHVLTPLRIGNTAVLVNRGWIPADPDRANLPIVAVNDNLRQVAGKLSPLPRPGITLKAPVLPRNSPWPRRLLYPTTSELIDQIGYAVYDYQLLMDQDNQEGFLRDWRPVLMSPEKHIAYSVQWFALAITLVIIFFVVNRSASDGSQNHGR